MYYKTIPFAVTLFLNPIFAPCPYHTMKQAFRLGLRTNKNKSGVVKERIEAVLANRTFSLFDRLFRDNLDGWTATAIVYV